MDAATDPFSDHAAVEHGSSPERDLVASSTLAVGRNATLTLGTDSLILLDEGLYGSSQSRCCGLLSERTANTRSIPYYNILWASATKVDITIHYAKPHKSTVIPSYIHYTLESSSLDPAPPSSPSSHPSNSTTTSNTNPVTSWVTRLMSRAYPPGTQPAKRIKLLINPFGGTGRAPKLYTSLIEPIFAAAHCSVGVERTSYSGHATEIAAALDVSAYDVLACASGDGLPHECFNGLARNSQKDALQRIAVTQLPCGSGNAFCWNFNGTGDPGVAALAVVKGKRSPFDLASLTQGGKRTLSFLSQSVGIVAESDLGTDNIRWMGEQRFTYGFLVRLIGETVYPCEVAVREEIVGKREIKEHFAREARRVEGMRKNGETDWEVGRETGLPPLRWGTVNDPLPSREDGWTQLQRYDKLGNFYCGNMAYMAADAPFFPASLPCDGLLDLVTIDGDVGRMKSVGMLLAVPKGTFFDMPEVNVRKISAVRVIPKYGPFAEGGGKGAKKTGEGYFSVCGESFPLEPFQIEIHKGIATVLSKRPGLYESHGPLGWEDIAKQQERAEGGATGNDNSS